MDARHAPQRKHVVTSASASPSSSLDALLLWNEDDDDDDDDDEACAFLFLTSDEEDIASVGSGGTNPTQRLLPTLSMAVPYRTVPLAGGGGGLRCAAPSN